jgi:hypothetical protein
VSEPLIRAIRLDPEHLPILEEVVEVISYDKCEVIANHTFKADPFRIMVIFGGPDNQSEVDLMVAADLMDMMIKHFTEWKAHTLKCIQENHKKGAKTN